MSHHEGEDGGRSHGRSQEGGGCCGGGDRGGPVDHDEETARSWERAFYRAFEDLQYEAVKKKLKDAWGERIDKGADAVVEAMLKDWEAFHKAGAAQRELREKLKGL